MKSVVSFVLVLTYGTLLCLLGCRTGIDPATEKALNAPVKPEGFDEKTIAELKCPDNGAKLRLATRRELEKINDRIGTFDIRTFDGEILKDMAPALLLREDGKRAYRFDGAKPNLKLGDALLLDKKAKK